VNQISKSNLSLIVFLILFSYGIVSHVKPAIASETISLGEKENIFSKKVTDLAEWFIGLPYKFGGDATTTSEIDNSHLICLIYKEAAKQAAYRFSGYMTMENLLQNTQEIDPHEIKVGDLIVLQNDHAALIYKFESDSKFYMIYASEKRQKVFSFNSHNAVYNEYWLKNLKGFFRLTKHMLVPSD
jgi:hypothetical protein